MMVEMQQQQQQQQPQPQDANGNANAEVPKYEVQTITMELGPDASTTEEHVNYSTDELFLGINKVSKVTGYTIAIIYHGLPYV